MTMSSTRLDTAVCWFPQEQLHLAHLAPTSTSSGYFSFPSQAQFFYPPSPPPPPQHQVFLTAKSVERCQYRSKFCRSHRAVKANGALHRLCDFHRFKANENQKRWTDVRRTQPENTSGDDGGSASPEPSSDEGTATAASPRRRHHRRVKMEPTNTVQQTPVCFCEDSEATTKATVLQEQEEEAVLSNHELDLLLEFLMDGDDVQWNPSTAALV